MTDPGQTPATPAAPELQFDRLEPTSDATSGAAVPSVDGILCASCGAVMLDEYYSIGGKSICANCRTSVEKTRATSRTPKAFGKAFVFGLGAALAGAAAYFAIVVALEGRQIAIFAIGLGWLVGRAIQKALPGGGSRRYQVLAAVLTYFAIGTAYMALGFREMNKDDADKKQEQTTAVAQQGRQDSAAVVGQQGKPATSTSATTKAGVDQPEKKSRSILFRIGATIVFALVLPVVVVIDADGIGVIISALIIALGIYQAWRMSGAPALKITGPFRVGGDAIAAGAS